MSLDMRSYFFLVREPLLAFAVSINHEEALVWRRQIIGYSFIFLDEFVKVIFVDSENFMR